MAKCLELAQKEVQKRKRQLETAQKELEEARKRVDELGGIEALKSRRDEEKAAHRVRRAMASVDELKKEAWKPYKGRAGSARCQNDDCAGKCDEMWYCRFDETIVACGRCLEAEHDNIYWPDVIDEWGPDLTDAWFGQASLPRYQTESLAQMLERAQDAAEWIKSRDDHWVTDDNVPFCALTWLGYTSECTHSGARSFWVLKGVPGVALCAHHFDRRMDRRAMILVFAYVVWHGAPGEPDSEDWFTVPDSHWGPRTPFDLCDACGGGQEVRPVTDWYTAWRLKDGAIQYCCARCYVKWRKPRCAMCDGDFSWKDVGNLQMEDNVLHYMCGKCHGEQ